MFQAPNGERDRDGVRWAEIAESCLSCIFHFSKDPTNRGIIRDRSILHNLRCLLGHNSENIQRLSAGILNEVSNDMDGAFDIQNEGLAEPVNGLVHSKNEKIGKKFYNLCLGKRTAINNHGCIVLIYMQCSP